MDIHRGVKRVYDAYGKVPKFFRAELEGPAN